MENYLRKPCRLATSLIPVVLVLFESTMGLFCAFGYMRFVQMDRTCQSYLGDENSLIHTRICCAFEHIRNAVIRKFHFNNILCSNVLSHKYTYQWHEFACCVCVCWNYQSFIVTRLCLLKIFISRTQELQPRAKMAKFSKSRNASYKFIWGALDSRYLIRRFPPLCVWWVFSI